MADLLTRLYIRDLESKTENGRLGTKRDMNTSLRQDQLRVY